MTLFGRYQLLEPLAVGGMAEVYRAQTAGASGFVKEVVIKRILPQFSEDQNFVRMFVDEARLAARLHHPNIVQVFDFDVADATYYIAMEYVEGVDLRSVLERASGRGEQLELAECLFIVKEIAKALDYAHRRHHKGQALEIVHRDVSPHNVMISFEGDVKLTDFGIAKATSRITQTQEGIVKGKTAYMSPEQAAGEPLDGRSDLFSLGTVLFELVAMRRLFVGESERDILLKVLDANIPSPKAYRRDLPDELERIIRKLLARRADRRYSGAGSLLKDLGRLYRQLAPVPAELSLRERLVQLFPDRARAAQMRQSGSSWPVDGVPPNPSTPVQPRGALAAAARQLAPALTPAPAQHQPASRPPVRSLAPTPAVPRRSVPTPRPQQPTPASSPLAKRSGATPAPALDPAAFLDTDPIRDQARPHSPSASSPVAPAPRRGQTWRPGPPPIPTVATVPAAPAPPPPPAHSDLPPPPTSSPGPVVTPFQRQSVVSGGADSGFSPFFDEGTQLYSREDEDKTQISLRPARPAGDSYWWLVVISAVALFAVVVLLLLWFDPFGLGG